MSDGASTTSLGERRIPLRWLALVPIALVAIWIVLTFRPGELTSYRVLDERTLSVNIQTGPSAWVGITGVTETDASVLIDSRTLGMPLPLAGFEKLSTFTVQLHEPLGSRHVLDATRGLEAMPLQ